jgi:hypothetical protein
MAGFPCRGIPLAADCVGRGASPRPRGSIAWLGVSAICATATARRGCHSRAGRRCPKRNGRVRESRGLSNRDVGGRVGVPSQAILLRGEPTLAPHVASLPHTFAPSVATCAGATAKRSACPLHTTAWVRASAICATATPEKRLSSRAGGNPGKSACGATVGSGSDHTPAPASRSGLCRTWRPSWTPAHLPFAPGDCDLRRGDSQSAAWAPACAGSSDSHVASV